MASVGDVDVPPAVELVTEPVLSGRPADLDPGMRLEQVTEGPLRDKAEAFVYDVYREMGYCDPSPRRRVEELQPWADRAVFHVVLDDTDRVYGTVRTVFGSYDELPIGHFRRTDFDVADPVCELGALAVDHTARSTGVIEHLYREGWLHACRAGASALVAVIEPWLLDVFTGTYGLDFQTVGEGQDYLGAYCVPAAFPHVPASYETLGRRNPEFTKWTAERIEIHEIIDWGFPIILTDGGGMEVRPAEPSPLVSRP